MSLVKGYQANEDGRARILTKKVAVYHAGVSKTDSEIDRGWGLFVERNEADTCYWVVTRIEKGAS
jgi:hypothetical protein